MKILMIADIEERALWDDWNENTKDILSDVELILSAGDLDRHYLEFLVTMLNVPLVYVRGNHDNSFSDNPPEGCIDADGRIVDAVGLKILGFGGSMRYKDNVDDMYSEDEMRQRVMSASRKLICGRIVGRLRAEGVSNAAFDILLTHAPCKGYGDMDDTAHTGFECFNALLEKHHPSVHCYGHVHKEYGNFQRLRQHPSGTELINASGYYIYEMST